MPEPIRLVIDCDIPVKVWDKLVGRAAARGQSMQKYLRNLFTKMPERKNHQFGIFQIYDFSFMTPAVLRHRKISGPNPGGAAL